jgi:hypothetical protein
VSALLSRQCGRAVQFLDLEPGDRATLCRVCLRAPDRDRLPEWARNLLDEGLRAARAAGHRV